MGYESPCQWSVYEVEGWAKRVKLSDETIRALVDNQVDGPTLVTLQQEELRSELGINSLPARRYLWELIQVLKAEQKAWDFAAAVELQSRDAFESATGPDESGGQPKVDPGVVNVLRSDAEKQRQVLEDHLLAHRLHRSLVLGEQCFGDFMMAREEQQKIDELHIQSEYDRRFAISLSNDRAAARREQQREPGIKSLFAMCIDTCLREKINVAEALQSGRVSVLERWSPMKPMPVAEQDEEVEVPNIQRCNVCYADDVKGFELACGHPYCNDCMAKLLKLALKDITLLPLQCCEIPIDMTVAEKLLKPEQIAKLERRTEEVTATRKMYCHSCGQFVNLDYFDVSILDFCCTCGEELCAGCCSAAHPNLTCAQNKAYKAREDTAFVEISKEEGWKQCPKCNIMIELVYGCNHMKCEFCKYDFCFRCLSAWDPSAQLCSSGQCDLWDEDRLVQAGENRVRNEEMAGRRMFQGVDRERRIARAMDALQQNEGCGHDWVRRNGYHGQCERCGYNLYAYAMVCRGGCGGTVCYTCAHHRIPVVGWR